MKNRKETKKGLLGVKNRESSSLSSNMLGRVGT